MHRKQPLSVALAVSVFLILAVLANNLGSNRVELRGDIAADIVHKVDEALDSTILGKTRESAVISRKEPNIVTALDLTTKPHYSREVDKWAEERRIQEMKDLAPEPSRNIDEMRREEEALQNKLDSMLKHGVHRTTARVNHVLKAQAKIALQNKAEIQKELGSHNFIRAKAPAFHSIALDKPVRVHSNAREQEIKYLQNKLAQKIAAGERLERENSHQMDLIRAHKNAKLASLASVPAAVATPKVSSSLADAATTSSSSSDDSSDQDQVRSWDSPPGEDPVPYKGFRDDAVPAARDTLKTSRDRVTARLEAQLRNSKERLERFRSHWSVYMPEDLRRATDAGWTTRYAKDYLNQGKTRSDLSSEEEIIRALKEDMDKKYEEEEEAASQLRDIKERENAIAVKVGDLSQSVEKDQRDLSIAERNANALRQHLPEYYDDLSDDDYRSLYRHKMPWQSQNQGQDQGQDQDQDQQQ